MWSKVSGLIFDHIAMSWAKLRITDVRVSGRNNEMLQILVDFKNFKYKLTTSWSDITRYNTFLSEGIIS